MTADGPAPSDACPRCGAGTRLGTSECSRCHLQFECRSCGAFYENPADDRFCTECGERVVQPEFEPADAALPPHVEVTADEDAGGAAGKVRLVVAGKVRDVFSAADAARGHLEIPHAVGRLARKLAPRRIGDLQLELSSALLAASRIADARQAFQDALDDEVQSHALLREVAAAAQRADASDLAVRALLEVALREPEDAESTVVHAGELMDGDVVDAHGSWILHDWYPRIRESAAGPEARACSALVACHAALLVPDGPAALQCVVDARREAPGVLAQSAPRILRVECLAPRLRANRASAHALLARLHAAADRPDEALSHIAVALAADVFNEDDARGLIELRAEQLHQTGRQQEAAADYVEAGRLYDLSARHGRAVDHFRRATKLDPGNALAYWYLADSQRFAAELRDYPYVDREMLEQALDDWQMGMRWRLPTRGQGWVYLTGALIHELLARVSDAPGELIHRAALQAEQAAALDGASADAWALLCRYHRILRQINVAQHAAAHALDCDRANANLDFRCVHSTLLFASRFMRPGSCS